MGDVIHCYMYTGVVYLSFHTVGLILVPLLVVPLPLPSLRNEVSDLDQLGYLGLCPTLSSLTLEGNPITATLAQEEVCVSVCLYVCI